MIFRTAFPLCCVLFATNLAAQSYTMTTVAGSSRLGDGNQATSVPLRYPYGVAQDAAGNIYFADASDNRVRRVGTNGVISTVAGNGVAGFSGDGGPATQAQLDTPEGLRLDAKGANLYIGDYNNNRVRMVTLATGVISTVAGNGNFHYSGDKGPAIQAGLDPDDIAVDASGNIYIADYLNNRVRKVSATDGTINTIAGLAAPGDSGDNGPAILAALYGPTGISVDAQNNVYFIDLYNNRVRKINQASGIITTAVGTGGYGYGEPSYDGNNGPATNAFLVYPFSTAVEPNGNLLVLCAFELWRVIPNGTIQFVAGSDTLAFAGDGGPTMNAKFAVPLYVTAAPNDDILLADVGNYRVRRISGGIVNTVAGTSILDGIPATTAFLNQPDGLAPDGKGGVVIGDTGDSRIRAVPSTGIIANLTGTGVRGDDPGELYFPRGVAFDSLGDLYIADEDNNRVMKLPAGSAVMLAAGNGNAGFRGDGGQASQAALSSPSGVAVDAAGNVYIADNGNSRIRVIDLNGNISTLAGNGFPVFLGDNGPAKSAQLSPYDVALDKSGNLYVADTVNHRIRKINLTTNIITTVAGIGTAGYSGDGGPATSAQLKLPTSMAVDAAGNLYIADNGNSVVRRVSAATGVITTIAGNGKFVFNVETGTAIGVSVDATRVAVDSTGAIYITDQFNDRIRKLVAQVPATFTLVSGNNQSGPAGTALPLPLVVKVVDATGAPAGGVTVTFSVSSGMASLTASTATTDLNGMATIQVTLGSTAGPLQIQAAVPGLPVLTFAVTITAATVGLQTPQISSGGVEGAALSVPAVLALSTGGIASVFGTNFGGGAAFQKVGPGDLVNGQVPVNFQGVCVKVGGTSAPVFGASSTQVNFQVPSLDSSGSATVQVIAGCGTANASNGNIVTVSTQPATPEFFYFVQNATGVNPVAATDSISGVGIASASLFPGSGFAPASPGQYVTIYATGFGATSPVVAPGVFPTQTASLAAPVTVTLGGVAVPAANILYVGVTPGSPGLYQLNLLIPASTPNGDLPLVIQVGTQQSPAGAYLTVQGS